MFHGTDKIHDFIRQASSLHVVNAVYFIALVVLTLFCHHAEVQHPEYPGLLAAISAGLVALLSVKLVFHCTGWLSRHVSDEQFELLVAATNASLAYAIVCVIQDASQMVQLNPLLDSFLPMALFVLVTPLTWRKSHVRYEGVYGFVEWSLLLFVLYWLSTILWLQIQQGAWFGLMSNIVVFLSPLFVRAIRQRHLRKLHDKMHLEIYIDPLTQISNRKHFYDFYDKMREKNKKHALHGDGIGVFFVDIDYFKQYNDHYGHEQGDACLHSVAQFLKSMADRLGLAVFRLGGEEFVLCGAVTQDRWQTILADPLMQSWIHGDLTLDIPHDKSPKNRVTLSAGASMVLREEMYALNAVGVTQKADSYLYKAKEGGRARLCIAETVESV